MGRLFDKNICGLSGHDWYYFMTYPSFDRSHVDIARICQRCMKYQTWDAGTALSGGRWTGSSWFYSDDVYKVITHYQTVKRPIPRPQLLDQEREIYSPPDGHRGFEEVIEDERKRQLDDN